MPLFWFAAGALTTLVGLILLVPWLRGKPRFNALPAVPWQISVAGVALVATTFTLHSWLGRSDAVMPNVAPAPALSSSVDAGAFADAAKLFDGAATPATGADRAPQTSGAGPMERAVAQLETRLAQGGGTADDWELLAKSYEFLGRPDDARLARARRLPAATTGAANLASANPASAAVPAGAAAAGSSISGEVILADALSAKATAGETLFIVAKSVDSPGVPVAVFRAQVGTWPVKFMLDDSL